MLKRARPLCALLLAALATAAPGGGGTRLNRIAEYYKANYLDRGRSPPQLRMTLRTKPCTSADCSYKGHDFRSEHLAEVLDLMVLLKETTIAGAVRQAFMSMMIDQANATHTAFKNRTPKLRLKPEDFFIKTHAGQSAGRSYWTLRDIKRHLHPREIVEWLATDRNTRLQRQGNRQRTNEARYTANHLQHLADRKETNKLVIPEGDDWNIMDYYDRLYKESKRPNSTLLKEETNEYQGLSGDDTGPDAELLNGVHMGGGYGGGGGHITGKSGGHGGGSGGQGGGNSSNEWRPRGFGQIPSAFGGAGEGEYEGGSSGHGGGSGGAGEGGHKGGSGGHGGYSSGEWRPGGFGKIPGAFGGASKGEYEGGSGGHGGNSSGEWRPDGFGKIPGAFGGASKGEYEGGSGGHGGVKYSSGEWRPGGFGLNPKAFGGAGGGGSGRPGRSSRPGRGIMSS